jgi:hypothetical protein
LQIILIQEPQALYRLNEIARVLSHLLAADIHKRCLATPQPLAVAILGTHTDNIRHE